MALGSERAFMAQIEGKLQASLKKKFSAFEPQTELGYCYRCNAEQKADGARVELFVPKDAAAEDKAIRIGLRGAFERFVAAHSPNLPDYHEVISDAAGANGKTPVLVLERCDIPLKWEEDLEHTSASQRLELFHDLARAVAVLHRSGLVHGNIGDHALRRETRNGPVKLCDIAFSLGDSVSATPQPLIYQSQEIINASTPSIGNDLHALGVLGYWLFGGDAGARKALTGTHDDVSEAALAAAIMDGTAPAPTEEELFGGALEGGDEIASILARLTGRGGAQFQDGASVSQQISNALGKSEEHADPIPDRPVQPTKPKQSRGVQMALVGIFVLGLLGGAGYLYKGQLDQSALDEAYAECRDATLPPGLEPRLQDAMERMLARAETEYTNGNRAEVEVACTHYVTLGGVAGDVAALAGLEQLLAGFASLEDRSEIGIDAELSTELEGGQLQIDTAFAALAADDPDPAPLQTALIPVGETAEAILTTVRGTLGARAERGLANLQSYDLSDSAIAGGLMEAMSTASDIGEAEAATALVSAIADLEAEGFSAAQAMWFARFNELQTRGVDLAEALDNDPDALVDDARDEMASLSERADALFASAAPDEAEVFAADWESVLAVYASELDQMTTSLREANQIRIEEAQTAAELAVGAEVDGFVTLVAEAGDLGGADILEELPTYAAVTSGFSDLTQAAAEAATALRETLGETMVELATEGAETASDETAAAYAGFSDALETIDADLETGAFFAASGPMAGMSSSLASLRDQITALTDAATDALAAATDGSNAATLAGAEETEGFVASAALLASAQEQSTALQFAAVIETAGNASAGFAAEVATLRSAAEDAQAAATDAQALALNAGVDPQLETYIAADAALADAQVLFENGAYGPAQAAFLAVAEVFAILGEDAANPEVTVTLGASVSEQTTALAFCRDQNPSRTNICDETRNVLSEERQVTLSPFRLDGREVTVAEFAAFVRETGYVTSAESGGPAIAVSSVGSATAPAGFTWRSPGGSGTQANPADPVTAMSFSDADAYCTWAGRRLPTADEWEFVASGGGLRLYPWGNDWQPDSVVWRGNTRNALQVVQPASEAQGISREGYVGMAGNLREWVSTENGGALKGGSWLSFDPSELRADAIMPIAGGSAGIDFGFRCARDIEDWN